MASTDLSIIIKAVDDASDKLKSIGESAKGLGLAFTAAGGVMTAAFGFAVKAASDAQVQMQGVDTVLSAMKSASSEAAQAVKDHTEATKLSALKIKELESKISEANASLLKHKGALGDAGSQTEQTRLKIQQYQQQLDTLKDKQEVQANLLKLAAGNFGDYRKQIVAAGKAAIDLGFDDEEASLSVTKLFQRTGDLNQAIKLNQLAMDLARAKHLDLSTAANMVGMVLSGNAKVLKQYGIDLKDTATPAEALNELQIRLKGSAQDYAQTFAGQSEILKVKLGNMQEAIGEKLLPILTELLTKIEPIISKIMEWMDRHQKLTEVIIVGVAALGALLAILGPILLALPALAAAIGMVGTALAFLAANPIVLIIAAIVALIAVIVLMITHWQKTKEIAMEVWAKIKDVVNGAMETIKNYLGAGMEYIQTFWKETWTAVKDYVLGIWQDIVNGISGFVNSIMDKINSVRNAISSVTSSVSSAMSSASSRIGGVFGGARAAGGPVMSGVPYLVGEQGPELFVPGSSGAVLPNGVIGGSLVQVTITGNTFIGEKDLTRKVGNELVDLLKLNKRI